jgi:hypothetical protein
MMCSESKRREEEKNEKLVKFKGVVCIQTPLRPSNLFLGIRPAKA